MGGTSASGGLDERLGEGMEPRAGCFVEFVPARLGEHCLITHTKAGEQRHDPTQ